MTCTTFAQEKSPSSFLHTTIQMGADDGSHGTYSCLSTEDDGSYVIVSYEGSGEIDSIWSTYDANSVCAVDNMTIYLDSTIVLDDSL